MRAIYSPLYVCILCTHRIAAMCDDFVGDLGDDVIYAQYKKQRSDVQKFTQWLCEGSGIRGHCANVGKTKQEL